MPVRVEPVIDLAPSVDRYGLAQQLAELIRQNVARDVRIRDQFNRFRGAVAFLPDDSGAALTLRFDFGRLIIHSGIVGVPDVTILGGSRAVEVLRALPAPNLRSLSRAITWDNSVRRALGKAFGAMRSGEVKIYGLTRHPRVVGRFVQLLSQKS